MTRLKTIVVGLIGLVSSAWVFGALILASNTAAVTAAPGVDVVDAFGNFLVVNDRTLAGATYKIVCEGDSITTVWIAPPGYCSDLVVQLATGRSITATWKSMGMSGYSWEYNYPPGPWTAQTLETQAPSQVDSEIYPGLTNILVMFAGTNGMFLGGSSAAQEYTAFTHLYGQHKAAGWTDAHIIVVTTVPRQDNAAFDTVRATYNTSLRSFCSSNGCKIADAGADAAIGCNGCEDNTNCFLADKIHLSASGSCGGTAGGGMNYLAVNLIYPQVP